MQIGISTASFFQNCATEDAIPLLKENGVPVAELFLNSFCEYTEDFGRLLRSRQEESGLSVYSLHPMSLQFEPQFFSRHPRQKGDALRIFRGVLDMAAELGASCYVMHGAATLGGVAKGLQPERVAPVLLELNELAAAKGITLALETVSWCILSSPERGEQFRKLTGDALHYTLDVKQCVRSGYSPLTYIDVLGERIANVHLCDYATASDGTRRWVMPGEGEADFPAIAAALRGKGYGGPAFIEVYSDMYRDGEELYRARERMDEIFNGEAAASGKEVRNETV